MTPHQQLRARRLSAVAPNLGVGARLGYAAQAGRARPRVETNTYENPYMARFVIFTRVSAGRNCSFQGFRPCRNPSDYDEPCHIRGFVRFFLRCCPRDRWRGTPSARRRTYSPTLPAGEGSWCFVGAKVGIHTAFFDLLEQYKFCGTFFNFWSAGCSFYVHLKCNFTESSVKSSHI